MRYIALLGILCTSLFGAEPPTFNRDVAPILYKNCANCHRDGEVAPFSLLTYQDAARRAPLIAAVTAKRFMPPWKPEPGHGDFQDSRRLRDADIDTIARWAKAGAPEGKPADKPAPPEFTNGWQLGEPDLVLRMPQAFSIRADGPDIYQCFVIPIDVPEDRAVAAVEFRPGNRKVVHHSIFYLNNSGAARKLDEASPEPGYPCFGGPHITPSGGLGGWAPGASPRYLPAGIARPVRHGADLVMQNHYHPTGKPETDQSAVGIYFARTKVEKTMGSLALIRRDLYIQPGDKRYRAAVSFTTPIDVEMIGIVPHMHLLGREMKVTATPPDGKIVPLIWVKDWDFNWQGQYLYDKPIHLPSGTRIDMESYYDNSAENPRNPNSPPKLVRWGEQTTDEMAVVFLDYAMANPMDRFTLNRALIQQLVRAGLSGQQK